MTAIHSSPSSDSSGVAAGHLESSVMLSTYSNETRAKGRFMPYLKSLPEDSVLINVLESFPETSTVLLDYHEALMRGESPFTVGERELIAAYVSGLNACTYCYGVHSATAEVFGISEGLLIDLLDDVGSAPVDPRMKPVLSYVGKLTKTPSRMTQADADAVFAAGWDDRALHDAVSVCALFNLMNRLVEGLGIKAGADYFAEAAVRLRDNGYRGLGDQIRSGEALWPSIRKGSAFLSRLMISRVR